MKRLGVFPLLLCVSCMSTRVVEFSVVALNTKEEKVPCIIYTDDQVFLDSVKNEPVLTPSALPLSFGERADSSGYYKTVKVAVRAVRADENGEIVIGSGEGEASRYTLDPYYLEDSRHIFWNDGRTQLFVLHRK